MKSLATHYIPNLSNLSSNRYIPSWLRSGGIKLMDARYFQIMFLISLLLFGALARDFSLTSNQIFTTFITALATQAAWQFGLKLPNRNNLKGYLSALITTCGICILVRSDVAWAQPTLAAIAMSSKFMFRCGTGKARGHILNPANLAAFLAMTVMPYAWLSPGQWGQETLSMLWMVALGGMVTGRISRWDISLTFIITWLGLLAARLIWLDYTPALGLDMWLHQALNGATILFAFFMISDPMTTPQHRYARIAYAICVAVTAFLWQYGLFKQQGMIVALFVWSFSVPLWNKVFKEKRFNW